MAAHWWPRDSSRPSPVSLRPPRWRVLGRPKGLGGMWVLPGCGRGRAVCAVCGVRPQPPGTRCLRAPAQTPVRLPPACASGPVPSSADPGSRIRSGRARGAAAGGEAPVPAPVAPVSAPRFASIRIPREGNGRVPVSSPAHGVFRCNRRGRGD